MGGRNAPELVSAFVAHYDELLRFLTRRLRDPGQAEDVVHDAYLRVAGLADAAIGNRRAYLYRIAGNLAVDTQRRDRRADLRSAPGEAADSIPDPSASPEGAVLAKQRLALLDAALARLPEKPRRALLMSRVDGRSFAAIAAELGVSESMVAKYIAQAMRACRDHLQQADDAK